MKRRVAILVKKGQTKISEEETPEVGKDDVLIKVRACGICAGDAYAFLGYPVWFDLPAALGHEPSGEVVEVGTNVTKFSEGDHITAMGTPGFSDFLVANESYVEKVPEKIPFEHAIGEPLACVVNAIRLICPKLGDNVAVVGTGFMGLLLVQALSRLSLENLVGFDINDERLKLAKRYGANVVLNPKDEGTTKEVAGITGSEGFDVVIEATGNPSGVGLATKLTRKRGKLVIFSYHPNPVPVDLRTWDLNGLEVVMANPNRAEDMRENLRLAVMMLARDMFDLEELVTHKWQLDEVQEALEYASKRPGDYIKGIIIP